ncbi:endoribonuclease l-psp protein [Phlyctema vagabunda]|uniref:Endoribonuclease l-psp protein n=1 Tax=Phlyctema vagabunda TaxID=108571 RepID=A0ABR4PAN5_9HELO
MSRTNISSGSKFEAEIGYSRAVVTGSWVFVSGTTGYDYSTGTISSSIVEQAEQTLQNISKALAEADASLKDVIRVRYILPDGKQFPQIWPVLRQHFGEVGPAATMIEAKLMNEEMLVEIEVTARKAKKDRK